MNQPIVSIIAPVYNVEKYLHEFIASIQNQSFKDFEVILVDDGSVDNSLEILHQEAALDNRFKVVSKKNQGTGAARNTGIEHSSGKYLLFLDPDDTISENLLTDNVKILETQKADIVVFGYSVYINNKPVKRIFFDKVKKGSLTDGLVFSEYFQIGAFDTLWNKLIRADIIKQNHVVSPTWRIAQDRGLLLSILKFKPEIVFNDSKNTYYNYNFKRPGSTVSKFNPEATVSINKSLDMIFDLFQDWQVRIPAKLVFLTLVNGLYFDAGLLNFAKTNQREYSSYLKKLNSMEVFHLIDEHPLSEWVKVLNTKEFIKLIITKYRLGGIVIKMMRNNDEKY